MAGPGIRYYHFAKELSRRFEVALVVPARPDVELPGVEVIVARDVGRRIVPLCRRFDAVVTQSLGISAMNALARSDTRMIYDLYVPFMVENLGYFAGQGDPRRAVYEYRVINLVQETALRTGDAFLCASERQRDLWLGYLGAIGRVGLEHYLGDPGLASLVRIVPFGVEAEPPRATARVLKGVRPGIEEGDHVLLWGGGIWNWFDPLTPIRAMDGLARWRKDVKLVFLGVSHPNPAAKEMAMTGRAVALARQLGLLDRHVFFNFGWVPYAERRNYLLEATLGVTAHFDNVETRFAFRTRMLDYIWAALPVVSTQGDVLSELVAKEGLGRTVPPEDADAFAAAICGLLDDEAARRVARSGLEELRRDFAWPRLVAELADLIEADELAPRGTSRAASARYYKLQLQNSYRRGGFRGVLGDYTRLGAR